MLKNAIKNQEWSVDYSELYSQAYIRINLSHHPIASVKIFCWHLIFYILDKISVK